MRYRDSSYPLRRMNQIAKGNDVPRKRFGPEAGSLVGISFPSWCRKGGPCRTRASAGGVPTSAVVPDLVLQCGIT